jgi:branched-chain amino acid transport system substrate-binding protein
LSNVDCNRVFCKEIHLVALLEPLAVSSQSDEPSEDRRASEIKGKHIPYLGYRSDLEELLKIPNSATGPPEPSTSNPPISSELTFPSSSHSGTLPGTEIPKNLTGAPMIISRMILIAAIAIISVVAYFAGSGAFKPYSTELLDFFSQTTALLPKKEALATAATSSDHDQVSASNDLSRSPRRPVVDTPTQTPVAAAKSAAPQTPASLPKEEALATAATNSNHNQVSAPNDLSRSPERPVVDTPTQTPVAAAKSAAVGDVSPRQPDGTKPTIQGVSDKEILFGMAAPLSGASRELGRQMKIGVETAFNQINSAGGVNGRLLRLVAADDGYEPQKTADAMHLLYDKEKVFGFIGNVGTPTAAVALPFALDHRALFFGAFTGASLLRRDPPDRYVFNYRASYAEETNAVVHYLVKVRRIQPKEIVVFAQQDSYGDSGYAGVQKAVRSLPGNNPDVVRLNYKRNTIDVQEAVDWLRADKGQIKAVVMIASYRAAAKFIEKTRDLYPSMIYTNVSFVGSTALADELMLLGPRYATGVIVTQVVPAINSYATIVLKYKEALVKYFPGESPDYVSFEGYVDASILAEAAKRVGRDIDTEKLVEELERMHDFDLGLGAPVTFTPNDHQGSHRVSGTLLDETGHYQPIDLE